MNAINIQRSQVHLAIPEDRFTIPSLISSQTKPHVSSTKRSHYLTQKPDCKVFKAAPNQACFFVFLPKIFLTKKSNRHRLTSPFSVSCYSTFLTKFFSEFMSPPCQFNNTVLTVINLII